MSEQVTDPQVRAAYMALSPDACERVRERYGMLPVPREQLAAGPQARDAQRDYDLRCMLGCEEGYTSSRAARTRLAQEIERAKEAEAAADRSEAEAELRGRYLALDEESQREVRLAMGLRPVGQWVSGPSPEEGLQQRDAAIDIEHLLRLGPDARVKLKREIIASEENFLRRQSTAALGSNGSVEGVPPATLPRGLVLAYMRLRVSDCTDVRRLMGLSEPPPGRELDRRKADLRAVAARSARAVADMKIVVDEMERRQSVDAVRREVRSYTSAMSGVTLGGGVVTVADPPPWLHLLDSQWRRWRDDQKLKGRDPDPYIEGQLREAGDWPAAAGTA